MPFDFLDGISFITDLLSLDFSGSSVNNDDSKKSGKKRKPKTLFWSVIFLLIALVIFLTGFNEFNIENSLRALAVCSIMGTAFSFVFFYGLYQIGWYYFRNLWIFLLFNVSVILMMISLILYIYMQWMV